MCKLEAWIIRHREVQQYPVVSFEELYCIGRELEQYQVSVKASNIFPITHGVVANVSFILPNTTTKNVKLINMLSDTDLL